MKETILRPVRALLILLGVRRLLLHAGTLLNPPGRPKVAQIRIMGFELLVLVNEDVGRRMAYLKRYETLDAEYLAARIRPGDICLDVGANTGYYTMLMARAAPRGQVHAFEPVMINWHLLGGGVSLNRLDNVVMNHSAVGAQPGEMEFSQSADGAYSSMVAVGRRPELRQIRVRVDSIDNYARSRSLPRIDVMKVDVEGAEILVLEGAANLLNMPSRRPRIAMLELNSVNLAAYAGSIRAVVAKMEDYGYRPFVILPDGRRVGYAEEHHDLCQNVFFLGEPDGAPLTDAA